MYTRRIIPMQRKLVLLFCLFRFVRLGGTFDWAWVACFDHEQLVPAQHENIIIHLIPPDV